MIKSLLIKNFQSHKDTFLEFCEGVNVIYGLSQAGKTAILRALKLIIYNRPSGGEFFFNFAGNEGQTGVEMKLIEGSRVTIIKSVKKNKKGEKDLKGTIYELHQEGKEDLDWSPGTDVPVEIRKALNVGETNIQSQFAKPFLIMSPGGEVARTINRITHLEEVDGWKTDLSKRVNSQNSEIQVLMNQATEIEQALTTYKGFEDLEEIINDLTKIDQEIEQLFPRLNRLDSGLVKYEDAEDAIKKMVPKLEPLEKIYSQIKTIDDQTQKTKDQIDTILAIKLMDTAISEMGEAMDDLINLEKIMLGEKQRNLLDNAIAGIEFLNTDIQAMKKKRDELKKQYMEILKRDKECPTCFGPIDKATIKRIEEEL